MGFSIEPKDDGCVFIASVHGRLPWLPRIIAKERFEKGLGSVKKHMKEEGENLKRILERE